jgi:hypothetical protein
MNVSFSIWMQVARGWSSSTGMLGRQSEKGCSLACIQTQKGLASPSFSSVVPLLSDPSLRRSNDLMGSRFQDRINVVPG